MNPGLTLIIVCVYISAPVISLKQGECEVCIGVFNKIYKRIPDEDSKSVDKIRQHVLDFCKDAKTKENSFCYVIGGLEESATGILKDVTMPMTYPMPADKLCEKLSKKDPQICELRYDKQIDLSKVDLKKLKVRDLKKILADWGEFCDGCLEKSDYVKRIEELKPQHVREEL